jgi:hypothetical protein
MTSRFPRWRDRKAEQTPGTYYRHHRACQLGGLSENSQSRKKINNLHYHNFAIIITGDLG